MQTAHRVTRPDADSMQLRQLRQLQPAGGPEVKQRARIEATFFTSIASMSQTVAFLRRCQFPQVVVPDTCEAPALRGVQLGRASIMDLSWLL
jgi:hypothetical protein